MKRRIRTRRIRLDASTACQLRCPACPTASGEVGEKIGTGFLRFETFRRIVDESPWLSVIELSNWGEIFLNPHLPEIVKYAYAKNVRLLAHNGTNLNTVREEVLEALVRYRFHHLSVSIDGASPETYRIYRVRGDFDTVIANVKKLNEYKRLHRSRYPTLRWQFVAFGHNQHEIEKARTLARSLGIPP
jgi:MoaA/NifB/PqqE/SkfB family radical SAM enzyme